MRQEKHPLCKQCPYFTHDFVPSEGPLDAEVFFVGDSPWRQESKYGRPLIGPAGEVFDALLEATGFDRRDVFISNTVHCLPEALGVQHPKEVVELCTQLYLKRELARVKPKLIVPMGNVAIKALGVKQAITSVRGTVKDIIYDDKPYKVLPTYHPSFLLRKPAYVPFGEKDFQAVRYYLDHGHEPPPNDDLDYRSVTTPDDIEEFFVDFTQAKRIAWDTETTGLDYRTDEILAMQWSFAPKTGYCMPFFVLPYDKYKGTRLATTYSKAVIGKLYDLLHDMDKVYFFHNGKFDLRMMHRFFMDSIGLPIMVEHIRWHDTMAMYGLLDENTSKSLKAIAPMYTDLRYVSEDVADVKGGQMKKMPLDRMVRYSVTDTDATRRIALKFGKMLREQNLWDIYAVHTASDMKIANILFKMELFGAPIDKNELLTLKQRMQGKLQHYYDRMKRMLGYDFNPNSDPQLRKILFDDLGFPIPEKKTPTGQICTDKFVVADLIAQFPENKFLKNFKMHREYTSIEETFVTGLEKKLGDDGRLHPDFGFTSMVSGRVACYKPNLTNIPRDKEFEDEEFVYIRGLFRSVAGKKVIYADCCLTGDTRIITDDGIHSLGWLCKKPRGISVLSINSENNMEFRAIERAAKIRRDRVYKLTFEDGSCVRCTAEHEWMMLDGNMKATKDLFTGDQFSHLYTWKSDKRPVLWSFKGEQRWAHQFVAEYAYGSRPEGYHVDHINANIHDFSRRNLRYLLASENHAQGGQRYWKAVKEGMRSDGGRLRGLREGLKLRRSYVGEGNPNFGKVGHGGRPRKGVILTCENPACLKQFYFGNMARENKRFCSWACYSTCRTEVGNHRLMSVEDCGYADVFQLTVESNHNYVLENGLVSGNSQIEFKVAAVLSGDAQIIKALFTDHEDFHTLVARSLYPGYQEFERRLVEVKRQLEERHLSSALLAKLKLEEQSLDVSLKTGRTRSKNFNFGRNYGAQPPKLAECLGTTEEKIAPFLRRLSQRFPDFEAYLEETPQRAIEEGELVTPFGRKRRFPPTLDERVQESQARQGSNFLPQSSAAYAVRAALVRIAWAFERTGMNTYPFNQVYDCIIVEAPDDEVEDAATIMAQEMLAPVPELGNHVFGIELGVGQSWRDSEKSAVKLYTVEDLPKLQSLIANAVEKL